MRWFVRYKLADNPTTLTYGGDREALTADDLAYETRKDALDDRNWLFGHFGAVLECWIENHCGVQTGARLKRQAPAVL